MFAYTLTFWRNINSFIIIISTPLFFSSLCFWKISGSVAVMYALNIRTKMHEPKYFYCLVCFNTILFLLNPNLIIFLCIFQLKESRKLSLEKACAIYLSWFRKVWPWRFTLTFQTAPSPASVSMPFPTVWACLTSHTKSSCTGSACARTKKMAPLTHWQTL